MTQETEKKPKMRLGLRLLLVGSLALNLLVVGIVGGAWITHKRGGFDGHPERHGSPYVRALSIEDKRSLGKALRQAYRDHEVDRRADRRSFERVVTLLRQTPLDRDALLGELALQRQAGASRREVAQTIWLEKISAMSDAERVEYADRLDEALNRKGRPKHDKQE